jgi:hypothetical protein
MATSDFRVDFLNTDLARVDYGAKKTPTCNGSTLGRLFLILGIVQDIPD